MRSTVLAELVADTLDKVDYNVSSIGNTNSSSRAYNGGITSNNGHTRSMVRVDVLKETRVVSDYELGEFPVGAMSSLYTFLG